MQTVIFGMNDLLCDDLDRALFSVAPDRKPVGIEMTAADVTELRRCAQSLLGSWRPGDAQDPETWRGLPITIIPEGHPRILSVSLL